MPKFNKKLRNAVILSFLIPVIILILSSGMFFYFIAKNNMESEMGSRLITIANLVSIEAKNWGFQTLSPGNEGSRTYRGIVTKLNRLKNSANVKKIYLFDSNNLSIVDSEENIAIGTRYYNHSIHKKEIDLSKTGRPASSVLFRGEDGSYYKSGFAPIYGHRGEVAGFVGVEGSADFFKSLETLKTNIIIFILIGTFLTILVGFILSRKIVTPLNILVKASKDIGEGNMKTEIKINSKDEIGFLAHAINEMKGNIIERDNRLRAMMQGIAHEVRNPLGGIELFAGLLKEEIKSQDEAFQYIEKIENEIKNLQGLVDEFLDFARSVKPVNTFVDMKIFTEEVKFIFLNELKARNIDLEIYIEGNNCNFSFDPDQIKRALLNIVRNAIDETDDGGKIVLTCSIDNNSQTITVIDSGKGIKEEIVERIFEPFFTTKDKGTGLGLSFAKKIVNSHNGDIRISRNNGSGTKVTISLPSVEQVNSL